MVTIDDILHHIAQDLRCYNGADLHAAVDEFLIGSIFDLHISITTDFEKTELDHLERYGRGHTYYFRLHDYVHGKDLAAQLYFVVRGIKPDMDTYTGDEFSLDDKLFLFIHIRGVIPTPAILLN